MIHTVKGFGIVNKAEIDVFLELSCFFDYPMDVGNLVSDSSVFSKTSLNIWKFTVPILLKPGLDNFEHYFTSVWDEYNCVVVWAYTHLNAEFQRIARRDKKTFLSDQCKEIEENNRMEKTTDLFKKIRDTKGTLHAKMGTIKDTNGLDLT